MFRNVASQKFVVFAFDATTGLPKTGDAANLTCYLSKDYGSVTVLGDTSATEMSSTNAPGYYTFDATQGETDFNFGVVTGKSTTSNIVVVGAPATIETLSASFDRAERCIVAGVVGSSSTTTSIITSSLTPSAVVTDQFKGRIVIFDKDTTTTSLRGQATDITGSNSSGVLTVTALTTAPVSGDTFVVQ